MGTDDRDLLTEIQSLPHGDVLAILADWGTDIAPLIERPDMARAALLVWAEDSIADGRTMAEVVEVLRGC